MNTFLPPIEKAPGVDHEAGVLLHTPAIWKSDYTAESAFCEVAACIRIVLSKDKKVNPDTFDRMSRYYSEREICEIVWLVASEHIYNMTNIGR